MRKMILGAVFLLSGCIYEQAPAPVNAVDIIDDTPQVQQPTSISYPLPDAPKNINNVIVNEPQPVPNITTNPNDQSIINNSIDPTPISNENQQPINTQNNDQLIDSIISDGSSSPNQNTQTQTNSAPVGSFNNPVKFDQSKVY